MKASRVTLDLDGHVPAFRLQAIRAYHGLERAADEVEVRVSSSGQGLHIIGWFSERLSDAEKDALRRSLGDDPRRTELDSLPTWHRSRAVSNVCWTRKGGETPEMDFDDVYDALDYINASGMVERFEGAVKAGLVR